MRLRESKKKVHELIKRARVKPMLRLLRLMAKRFIKAAIGFARKHRGFTEAMILGMIAAGIVSYVPGIGNALAVSVMAAAAVVGISREVKEAAQTCGL